jgi:hypothetical protein
MSATGIGAVVAVKGSQVAAFNGATQAPVAAAVIAPFLGNILAQANR